MKARSFLLRAGLLLASVLAPGREARAALIDRGSTTMDTDSGLEWLDMSASLNVSAASIVDGSSPLTAAGWRLASLAEVRTLCEHAGMTPPFDGTQVPWNFAGADRLLGLLGHTYSTTSEYGTNVSIQAFSGEGPSGGMLFTPVVITFTGTGGGTWGGADFPTWGVPSSVASPTIGNWLVRLANPPKDAYITRLSPPNIAVVDLAEGTIRRTIPFPPSSGPQEVAISLDAQTLYVGDNVELGFATLDIVDIASATITQRVTVGSHIFDPIVDLALLPDGGKLYTANWTASTVTAVNLAGSSTSDIWTGWLSNDVTASPDGARVYATALNSSDLFVIDPTSDEIVDRISIGRDYLGHVAVTPDGNRAYVTEYRNRVTVVDIASGSVLGSIPFDASGANPNNIALEIGIDPQGHFAYALGYDTVNVIDLSTDTIRATIDVGKELRGLAIDAASDSVYVMTAAPIITELPFTELVRIDTRSFTIASRFVIGGDLEGLAIGPSLGPLNEPPEADAGPDQTLECSSLQGAVALLDGSGSNDPDSTPGTNDDIASFEWFEGYGSGSQVPLGTGPILETTLPLGRHVITLVVTDRTGEQGTDECIVTTVDTTPPVVAVELTPTSLWPPNHRLVEATAAVSATDACSIPDVRLASLSSNEPDDAPGAGDGHTTHDIQDADLGAADHDFRLRAERDGNGDGRSYRATYSATDTAGTTSFASAVVTVPHDRSGVVDPVTLSLLDTGHGTSIAWGEVPGARWYNVVRGNLRDVRTTPEAINLGVVACIEERSLDTNTAGHDDADTPAGGEGFFYLVEYDDGMRSSFGSEDGGSPRVPVSGGCP